jgi:GNAT superfamily N-acetyltransferase
MPGMLLRDIDPHDPTEITLVAGRMRDTLIEVEGPQRGSSMYSMQWLEDRVRWHLDPAQCRAKVVLALDPGSRIVGHSIYRIEVGDGGEYGLVSTTYVLPEARRQGYAQALLAAAESWCLDQGLSLVCTWTSASNAGLIALYRRNGYDEVERGPNDLTGTTMVRLAKVLPQQRSN